MAATSHDGFLPPQRAGFATTQWSLILSAADSASPRWQQALAQLCQLYWYPLYAFVRRQGHAASEAEDLTQEFFLRLLDKGYLDAAGPEKGKFRTFLLVCMRRFLANEHDRARAQKRGGDRQLVSIDFSTAESRYQLEPAHHITAERIFERRWALALLDAVIQRLKQEYINRDKQRLFEELKATLVADEKTTRYVELASKLQLSEAAVKVAVHRLRKRFGQLLSAEVSRTVDGRTGLRDEIDQLIAALGRPH